MKSNILLYAMLAIAILTLWIITASRKDWKRETNRLVDSLTGFSMDGSEILLPRRVQSDTPIKKDKGFTPLLPFPPLDEFLWEEDGLQYLPHCVKRYLHRSLLFTGERERNLEEKIRMVRTVEIDQEGSIFFHGKWVPFLSKMHYSASLSHPGFVWDARIKSPLSLSFPFFENSYDIYVRSAHVNGVGSMAVKVMGIIPSIDIFGLNRKKKSKDRKEEEAGKILKWLSGTPFFPTSLLPHAESGVKWKTHQSTESSSSFSTSPEPKHTSEWVSAIASFTDPISDDTSEVEFQFDDNGMVSSVYAKRPRSKWGNKKEKNADTQKPSDQNVLTLWESRFRDYQVMGHGMLIPTRMSAGWWEENGFQPHFHVHNVGFNFTYF
jgi:hypothetical protein